MVLPQHETKKPKYARWVFLSGHISKINQRTKHVESLKTRRLDEGSNPSGSTKKALRKRAFFMLLISTQPLYNLPILWKHFQQLSSFKQLKIPEIEAWCDGARD